MTVTPIRATPRPDAAIARTTSHVTPARARHETEGSLADVLLVVSSNVLVRRGLQALLSERGLFVNVQAVASAAEALAVAAGTGPLMIALDGGASASQSLSRTCRDLLRAAPQSKVIVIAAPADTDVFRSCFNSGVLAWVCPDSDDLAIVTALEMVHRGQRFLDPRVALRNATEPAIQRSQQVAYHLTRREYEVLSLLSEGCSNRAISTRLAISETTVKGHVSSILAKLGAESRLEAALMASQVL
ncbi:response regulator transcription factor [Sphaerisporangium sp. NPDC051011]|uniref:response regulator transcription factor n=1 Tax=Sphaerisporangium sp. NPDC051011 TaxID=3155792 RepID=UPI0033D94098